jgi:hypothetical protein
MTFGALPGGSDNYIEWLEVAFGEWESNCMPGTTLCTFDYSSYPTTYYGGPQYYPNSTIAYSNTYGSVNAMYGPYQTFDGIDLSGNAVQRQALSSFTAQLPPSPCTVDSHGYCAVNTATYGTASCQMLHIVHGQPVYYQQPYSTHEVYSIITSSAQAGLATETITKGNTLCTPVTTTWSPGEPKVTYNDSNLP